MLFFYENKGSNTIYADVREKLGCAAHLHGHLEIVFMKEGSVELNVEGKDYILRENEALIIFPNQLHSYKDIAKSRSTLLIFAPELLQPDYKKQFTGFVPETPVCEQKYHLAEPYLEELLRYNNVNTPEAKGIVHGLLLVLCGKILKKLTLTEIRPVDLSCFKSVLAYCNENFSKNLSLQSVADELHINKYYICHLLKNHLNMSFTEYINNLRINEACGLLKNGGHSITETALSSGFSSIRTFNRNFKNIVGVTPSEYIRETD